MLLCDGARGVLYGIIPLLWFLTPGSPHIWLLYVVPPVATAFGMAFHIAYVAAVPSLVPREDLTAANGKLEATYAAMTLLGMALALIGLSTNVFTVAALAVGFMFCTGVAGTCSVSLRQEITPSHLLGRVTAAFWTIHNSLGPIGAALITVAIARYSVGGVALVMGVLVAAIAVSGLFTALCRTWEQPAANLELHLEEGGA